MCWACGHMPSVTGSLDSEIKSSMASLDADIGSAMKSLDCGMPGQGTAASPSCAEEIPYAQAVPSNTPPSRAAAPQRAKAADKSALDEHGIPSRYFAGVLSTVSETFPGRFALEFSRFTKVNYSTVHCGMPVITDLKFTDLGLGARSLLLEAEVPGYSRPWRTTLQFPSAERFVKVDWGRLSFDFEKLAKLIEADMNAQLDVKVSVVESGSGSKGEIFSKSYPIEVLAFNEYCPLTPGTVVAFIYPNEESLDEVFNVAKPILKQRTGDTSFCGYQMGQGHADAMVESLYDALVQLRITYSDPPASFEIGQKILTPKQILKGKKGTCMDLALLQAALLERAGIAPVFAHMPGHVFTGYWRNEPAPDGSDLFIDDKYAMVQEIRSEGLKFFNSTTCCDGRPFMDAVNRAHQFVENDCDYMIDVLSARRKGLRPMPFA
jgi:hypothetical protein